MTSQPSRLDVASSGAGELTLHGVMDSHTAEGLTEALTEAAGDHDLKLDLAAVEFIDSSGLRSLITSHQEHEAAGRRLVLSHISPAVARLFEITGLRDHLHILG